ncbi:MAG: hypothetical protein WEG36_02195 [Gemmatimonadota bacterium]
MSSAESLKTVEMVREIRDRHHELLKGKSPEERDRFYREQAAALYEKLGVREKAEKGA